MEEVSSRVMLSVRRDNVNVSNGDTQLSVLKKIGPVRSTKESNHLRKLNAGFKTGIKGKATRRVLTDISNSNFRYPESLAAPLPLVSTLLSMLL